jgi:hypothetical protein
VNGFETIKFQWFDFNWMFMMKKILFVVLMFATLLLAACGGGAETPVALDTVPADVSEIFCF